MRPSAVFMEIVEIIRALHEAQAAAFDSECAMAIGLKGFFSVYEMRYTRVVFHISEKQLPIPRLIIYSSTL
jgi:hypothetical protein